MLLARQGSILATSISLVAVFLTLVIGSMAYVQSAQSRTLSDKFRLSAEQAARTGMDFVMGFGEANIDLETRLPRRWDSMSDGQVIDPVSEAANLTSTGQVLTDLQDAKYPGQIVGTSVREYVLGRQGQYVTTFKARIEQFRVSDNVPRQYRIGVIGRVRRIRGTAGANIDLNERATIVAERVILAHVGKQPVSRYAALIDIDLVRNWVPGEIVDGPVHINRGYVDEFPLRDRGFDIGANAAVNGDGAADTVLPQDIRSRMDLFIEDAGLPGNPGFATPPGGEKYPIFNDEVTVTEIGLKELDLAVNQDLKIKNWDHDYDKDDTADLPRVKSNSIRVNQQAWGLGLTPNVDGYASRHRQIFRAAANQNTPRYGGIDAPRGPVPIPYPIQLPRSVRNRLASAVGAPPGGINMTEVKTGFAEATRWDKLKDGLYVPTTRFWGIDAAFGAPDPTSPPPTDSFKENYKTTGGIYIRGNVEIMRMAAGTKTSYYLFQIGPGSVGAGVKRSCYAIGVDRELNIMRVMHLSPGALTPANEADLLGKILAAAPINNNLDNLPGRSVVTSTLTNPASFEAGSTSYGVAVFTGQAASSPYDMKPGTPPFNGVIYVDCAQYDQGRPESGTYSLTSTPVSGNILCLGDPGARGAVSPYMAAQKRALSVEGETNSLVNGVGTPCAYEGVATYVSDILAGPASKLTIMARGNIFIQNHLLLRSLVKPGITKLDDDDFNYGNLTIKDSRDLLGMVADKQIVIGLCAPSMTTLAARGEIGTYVQAAIAALGDPSFEYQLLFVPDSKKQGKDAYNGSFGVEGLVQVYDAREDYKITSKPLTSIASTEGTAGAGNLGIDPSTDNDFLYFNEQFAIGTAASNRSWVLGYPGNPFYRALYGVAGRSPYQDLPGNNPNKESRGKLRVLGAITEKKRGIKGQGNLAFDKDFKFDRRLLTIAPPIFPASLNVIVRTQSPFSPDQTSAIRALPYEGVAASASNARDLKFFGTALPPL